MQLFVAIWLPFVTVVNCILPTCGYKISDNVVLSRSTYQSSVYDTGTAEKAVDGNESPLFFHGSCAETAYEINPWWAVRLDDVMDVIHVDIVNRGDCCAERLHDFTIGLTNTTPTDQPPVPGSYTVCHQFSGIAGSRVSVRCDSNAPGPHVGQYVIIQIPSIGELTECLAICEVSVYAAPVQLDVTNPTRAHVGQRLSLTSLIGHSFTSSKLQCAALCLMTNRCGSINFRPNANGLQGFCKLNWIFIFVGEYNDDEVVSDEDWHWYEFM